MVAPHQAVDHQLAADRLDGAAHARIVGRQEADQRQQQQAGIQRLAAEILHEAPFVALKPSRHTVSWMRVRSARQRSSGPFSPNSSAARIARSIATQTIALEKVKCCAPPRTSQMLSSGCSQISSRWPTKARQQVPTRRRADQAERTS